MIDGKAKIDYRYLNLITNKFATSQKALIKELERIKDPKLVSISNVYGQVLIAGGDPDITECYAIITCKKLTGAYSIRD